MTLHFSIRLAEYGVRETFIFLTNSTRRNSPSPFRLRKSFGGRSRGTPPAHEGPEGESCAACLRRRYKPALLLFHLDLLGDADGVFGVGFCH